MELGKRIKQLRLKAELTQEQLAEQLSVSAQAISKWENAAAMPDIALLPRLSEVFGVSIDDLFDLTAEQRLNRIESRLDSEDDLPQDVLWEYEEFLKAQLASGEHRQRATELLAGLHYHRMYAAAQNVKRYAMEAIRQSPDRKGCQWMLQMADGHAAWDWNINNHARAIAFYRELIEASPETPMPYWYLLDNLIADRRADEAEQALERLLALKGVDPVMSEIYRAHIALARFDAPAADAIIERLVAAHGEDSACLFETAQYYAGKCDYQKAIDCYERAFDRDPRRPRFIDALQGIANIHEITGNCRKAAQTYDRIIDLLTREWGMTDEAALKDAQREKARLLAGA